MKKVVSTLALLLAAGAACASPSSIGVSNQFVQDGGAITVTHVTLAQSGFVSIDPVDRNGDLVTMSPLGRVYLPAGSYSNVHIPLDPSRVKQFGYLEGGARKAYARIDLATADRRQANREATQALAHPLIKPFVIARPNTIDG